MSKKPFLIISRFSTISFLIFALLTPILSWAQPSHSISRSEFQNLVVVENTELLDLIYIVHQRLTYAAGFSSPINPQIVRDKDPMALSYPDGTTILSIPLLRRLNSEAELAFVLAHELAHLRLGHFKRRKLIPADELKCDSIALGYLVNAGYSASAAVSALQKFEYTEIVADRYPPSRIRIARLVSEVEQVIPINYSTSNDRKYLALVRKLR